MEKKPGRTIQEKNAQKRTRLDLDGMPQADIKSKLLRNYFVVYLAYGSGILSLLIKTDCNNLFKF